MDTYVVVKNLTIAKQFFQDNSEELVIYSSSYVEECLDFILKNNPNLDMVLIKVENNKECKCEIISYEEEDIDLAA